jgi:hypothetical protein
MEKVEVHSHSFFTFITKCRVVLSSFMSRPSYPPGKKPGCTLSKIGKSLPPLAIEPQSPVVQSLCCLSQFFLFFFLFLTHDWLFLHR